MSNFRVGTLSEVPGDNSHSNLNFCTACVIDIMHSFNAVQIDCFDRVNCTWCQMLASD